MSTIIDDLNAYASEARWPELPRYRVEDEHIARWQRFEREQARVWAGLARSCEPDHVAVCRHNRWQCVLSAWSMREAMRRRLAWRLR